MRGLVDLHRTVADQSIVPSNACAEDQVIGGIGKLQDLREWNVKMVGRHLYGFVQDFLQVSFVERIGTEARNRPLL